MKTNIIRFAELYSAEFMERLNIGRFDGSLTDQDLNQARELWALADSMAVCDLVNVQNMATTMHVASLDNATGYFDEQIVQNLTLNISERLEEIQELKSISDDALSVVRDYELKQAKARC